MAICIIDHPQTVTVGDIVDGFREDKDTGAVYAYHGRLNVRPAYQREFVWDKGGEGTKPEKQQKLIDSIMADCPISVMYWVKIGVDADGNDKFECLDGQQRIITMCRFYEGKVSLPDGTQYSGLPDKMAFLRYHRFPVYICEADTLEEKLAWFRRINMAGEPLADQEMRSAIACGDGTTLAKKYFVQTLKNGQNAYSFDEQTEHSGRDYIKGDWNRQAVYERIVSWRIGSSKDEDILAYMKNNRDNTAEAEALFEYFRAVVRWTKQLFPNYRKEMKDVDWGLLYNEYKDYNSFGVRQLANTVNYLMADTGSGNSQHLESTKGIYEFAVATAAGMSDDDAARKYLTPRTFTKQDMKMQYECQHGVCPHCMKRYEFVAMHGDHIVPYHPMPVAGQRPGPTIPSNLQMLCHSCNIEKKNLPFDKAEEERKLQRVYELTDEEVEALEWGAKTPTKNASASA